MRLLILGHGKTGKLVAEVAAMRGHSIHVLDAKENPNAAGLTPPFLAGFDVVIDFTTPEAVIPNLRACLANGARVVVGTTGWYGSLHEMRSLAERKHAALLYGSNYSLGVQVTLKLVEELSRALAGHGYTFHIRETHHVSKLDAPSGTAITLQQSLEKASSDHANTEIESFREGDASGLHVVEAQSESDRILITHEAFSRRGFAEGAVRAAEWLAGRTGCFDYRDIFNEV